MITKETIEALAKLARLELSDVEKESLGKDISNVIEYVGQINAIAGTPVGPLAPTHHNIMRADTPRQAGDQLFAKEEVLRAQFPTRKGNYNSVRKILQKDE